MTTFRSDMTLPSPNEIARLRELLAKATPGPWSADDSLILTEHANWLRQAVADTEDSAEMFNPYGMAHDASAANAELIVAAVNALSSLLDTAERAHALDAENKRLREALASCRTAGGILLQNAKGCATNHYGEDLEKHGLPGWIADCERDIAFATEVLMSDTARAALKGEGA